MTELGGVCAIPHCENNKLNSVGVPLPGMLFKVSATNWKLFWIATSRNKQKLFNFR